MIPSAEYFIQVGEILCWILNSIYRTSVINHSWLETVSIRHPWHPSSFVTLLCCCLEKADTAQTDHDSLWWTWARRVERSFWRVWQGLDLRILYSRHIDCHCNPQDGSGTISTVELLHVLRAMGQNPSEVELNTIIMEIDIDGSGTIDFMEFVNLMKEKLNDVDIENDIREEVVSHSHLII